MKMDERMEINGGGWRWMKRMEMNGFKVRVRVRF